MQLSFVTGKGGVGKTRVSCLLAAQNPQASLAETTEALAAEAKKLGLKPPPIFHFSRADLAEEFLVTTVKIRTLAKLLSRSNLFQTLLSLAPNLNELLLLKKWIDLSKEGPLIVDAPATGHFLAIFESIHTAEELFDGGSLREIATEVDQFFRKNKVVIYLVTLPERSAMAEMDELQSKLSKQYPGLEFRRILNRKHRPPPASVELPSELFQLASSRIELEENRLQGTAFDRTLFEGQAEL